jgi:solute carrier family 8 (sodium/calcium exchanger)
LYINARKYVYLGVFKKLEASGKKKKCKQVGDWARSVSNHLYWCAASSEGDGELVLEKWLSVLNHITNIHDGHGKLFPSCLHGELEDRDWIKKG